MVGEELLDRSNLKIKRKMQREVIPGKAKNKKKTEKRERRETFKSWKAFRCTLQTREIKSNQGIKIICLS